MRFYLYLLFSLVTATAIAQEMVPQLHAKLASGPDTAKIQTCLEISKAYAASQPDSAVDYCNRGMRLAEKLNDRHYQALILLELGRINALHHHTELARRFTNESLSVFRNLHEPEGVLCGYFSSCFKIKIAGFADNSLYDDNGRRRMRVPDGFNQIVSPLMYLLWRRVGDTI